MKNRIQVAAACCALLVAMPGVAMISENSVRDALQKQQQLDVLSQQLHNRLSQKADDAVLLSIEQDAQNNEQAASPSLKNRLNSIYRTSGKLFAFLSAGVLRGYKACANMAYTVIRILARR